MKNCYNLPFYTLTLFTLFNIICVVQCQICNLKRGKLPQGWKCDGEPHVISKHKEEIERYCGFKVSSTLPAKVTEKVSNGRPALPGELPYYASIAYKGRAACGAALIDNYHLVTAAHCVLLVDYEDPNGNGIDVRDLKVQMGTVYRYETKAAADDPNRITIDVEKIYRHRGYVQGFVDATTATQKKGAYGGSDIAIIKLSEPMPFSSIIWPICLVSEDLAIGVANQKTSPIILSGFGQDEKRDVKHVQLQVSKEIRLLEKDECEKSMDSEYGDLGYTFKDGQMCTVALKEGKAVGACKGDSGGPLAQYSRGRHYLLGLVSYGPGDCLKGSTTIPDVHTNVTYFQKWMNGIVTSKWDEDEYYEKECKRDDSDCQHFKCTRAIAERLCPVKCQSDLPKNHLCAAKEDEPTILLTTTEETLTTTAESPDICKDHICLNGGTCQVQNGNSTCNCDEHHYGETCEKRKVRTASRNCRRKRQSPEEFKTVETDTRVLRDRNGAKRKVCDTTRQTRVKDYNPANRIATNTANVEFDDLVG